MAKLAEPLASREVCASLSVTVTLVCVWEAVGVPRGVSAGSVLSCAHVIYFAGSAFVGAIEENFELEVVERHCDVVPLAVAAVFVQGMIAVDLA